MNLQKIGIGIFEGYDNITPVMTSDNTPVPYILTGNNDLGTSQYALFRAVDGTIGSSNMWASNAAGPWYWQIDFGSSLHIICKYKILGYYLGTYYPTDWTFQGSNDDSNWTTLDTQTSQNSHNKEYLFSNTTRYRYYKFNITANYGVTGPRVDAFIFSAKMFSHASTTINTITANQFYLKSIGKIEAYGGVVSYDGAYRIHTFITNGTFTVTSPGLVQYLVVAAGGGGGGDYSGYAGGGGGGGGVLKNSICDFPVSAGSYSITVGIGGAGGSADSGVKGGNSVFSSITAEGGGRGGYGYSNTAGIGGSGGGGGMNAYAGAAGVSGQGYAGGSGEYGAYVKGGGGGGASEAGHNANAATEPSYGGDGIESNISGTSVYYGGGGGGGNGNSGGAAPSGGTGGGGIGGKHGGAVPGNGVANTGGGGGGAAYYTPYTGGNGGSGIVIIRYKYI